MTLTDLEIKALAYVADGSNLHSDGDRLFLAVMPNGSKVWWFIFQFQGRRQMSLGAYPKVSLADARTERDKWAAYLPKKNPIMVRKLEKAGLRPTDAMQTLGAFAESIIDYAVGPGETTREQYLTYFVRRFRMGQRVADGDRKKLPPALGFITTLPPQLIGTDEVKAALLPYWKKTPGTARLMRQRLEKVLDAARTEKLIVGPWENPARMSFVAPTLGRLPSRAKVHRKRASLPWNDVREFLVELRQNPSPLARLVELTIMTVPRSKEVRLAKAREIDLEAKVWRVPANRMKREIEHVIPLSSWAVDLLKEMGVESMRPDQYVFANPLARKVRGAPYCRNAPNDLVVKMRGQGVATLHGFRRTFRNWIGDETDGHERVQVEWCLAHSILKDEEASYYDASSLRKRRAILEDWNKFLASNVVPLRKSDAA